MSFGLARGFSDSAFTPTRALVAGLLVGGAVIVGLWTYGSLSRWLTPDPAAAPPCFGTEQTNHTPGTTSAPNNPADRKHALWWGPRGDHRIEQMTAAEYVCTVASCDRQAWAQYRSALFWYLSERMQRTRRLDAVYGDPGLQRARDLFDGRADRDIEQGLRARYKAGIFRIKDFRQQQDAIAILILANGAALRPCRRA